MDAHSHAHMYTCTHAQMNTLTHAYTHVHTYTHAHTCTYARSTYSGHVRQWMHSRTRTRTRTRTNSLPHSLTHSPERRTSAPVTAGICRTSCAPLPHSRGIPPPPPPSPHTAALLPQHTESLGVQCWCVVK
jgi:hypothetical protein